MKGREMRIRQEVLVSWPQPVRELFCPAKGTVLGIQCQCWMTGSEECSQADLLRGKPHPLAPLPQGLWNPKPLSPQSTLCGNPSKSWAVCCLSFSKLQELGVGRLTLLWVEGTGHGLPSPPGLFFLGGSVTVALVSTG